MKTAEIVSVLNDMGIGHTVDPYNPSFTVLLDSGGMIDRRDALEGWQVLSLDREFSRFVALEHDFRRAMKDLLAHEKSA